MFINFFIHFVLFCRKFEDAVDALSRLSIKMIAGKKWINMQLTAIN